MWIERDFLRKWNSSQALEAVLIRGPRQIGKTSTLLRMLPQPKASLFLDDPTERTRAQKDPDFVISQLGTPCLIDEIQKAPELLDSIKHRIDQRRRERIESGQSLEPASYRMTGSNQTQIDRSLRESLAGRVSLYRLHGLSVNEIHRHDPSHMLAKLLFRGGMPELWVRPELDPVAYFNDYYTTFVERDIAASAGVEKLSEFAAVSKLIAARVGELYNVESLSRDAGVTGNTIKGWISALETNGILHVLRPYSSNLNKRLIKMPKLYFLDSGLCVRLQGHREEGAVLSTPQAGHLFENLVLSELIKTRDHFRTDWTISFWRTKEKEEIDFVIESREKIVLLEAKLGSSRGPTIAVPQVIQSQGKKVIRAFVIATGSKHIDADGISVVPIQNLCAFLVESQFL